MKSQLIFVPGQVGRAIQALFNSFSQQPTEVSRRIAPFYTEEGVQAPRDDILVLDDTAGKGRIGI